MTVGANVVDPQRWNRYGYARLNPTRFLDPDGREVLLASGRDARLDSFLTNVARRAQGRAILQRLVDSELLFVLDTTTSLNPSPAQIETMFRNHEPINLTFGRVYAYPAHAADGSIERRSDGSPVVAGANMVVDTGDVVRYHERSGVVTLGHELLHLDHLAAGHSIEMVEGTDTNGSAEAFGRTLFEEPTDIRKEQAREFIRTNLVETKHHP
jgi:hypothetical protein